MAWYIISFEKLSTLECPPVVENGVIYIDGATILRFCSSQLLVLMFLTSCFIIYQEHYVKIHYFIYGFCMLFYEVHKSF